jgi:electron transport complex protein RnfC
MSTTKGVDEHIKFKGGVHPDDGKELTRHCAVVDAPLLDKYTVIISQHIGAPAKLLVKKGDEVKKGQVLAEAGGFVSSNIHAPTSGTISMVKNTPGPVGGKVPAVEITADGNDEWGDPMEPMPNWCEAEPADLKQRIADSGIVGMGGAAFPAHVKLSPPDEKPIDTLILNGAECEPYLTADHRLMLETPEAVIEGSLMLGRVLGVKEIFIGIEANKPDAIELLKKKAEGTNVIVKGLRVRYPQGAEKQLIYALTGRKVPVGGLPMDVGCVVQNVGTAAAVSTAVLQGRPLIERITTVTGKPVVNPGNWRFRLGTPVFKALELAGGVNYAPAKVLLGGPMMGFSQMSLDVTIMKNSSGILLLALDEVQQYESNPCIHCGRCVEACPMHMLPGSVSMAVENEEFDLAIKMHAGSCIECGSCTYACPANRPLTQHCKRAKVELMARSKK